MKQLLPILFIALSFAACTKSRTYFPKNLEPQPVEIVRFDNALLNINTQSALQDIRIISNEYPTFFPFFVENILGVPANDTAFLAEQLPRFLEDTLYVMLYTLVAGMAMMASFYLLQTNQRAREDTLRLYAGPRKRTRQSLCTRSLPLSRTAYPDHLPLHLRFQCLHPFLRR